MTTHLSVPVLIFLLSSIGLIVLPHAWNIAPTVFGFFNVLLLWRFAGIWKKNWLPNQVVLFILTCCGIALIYQQNLGVFGRNAGTTIFITALGLKLLEIRNTRDLYFIAFLAFIVAATLFLYEQSIAMAVYIVGVCATLLATLVIINMHSVNVRRALKTAVIILVQALPLGITFFILFPRLEAPHWSFLQDKSQVKTGLSETLEPGGISDLALSDELVFRAKFTGDIPAQSQLYWRGPVFSLTDGKTWLPLVKRPMTLSQAKLTFKGEPYRYTLLMEPQEKNWVFALDMPATLPIPLGMTAYYQLTTGINPNQRAEYTLQSYVDYQTDSLSDAELKENLQLPPVTAPEIITLVKTLHGFENSPSTFINALLNHFRTQQFVYSLTPPLMEDKPIETFLFKTRTGFCSHYATAFVYLMRVAHIPARVVSGYQGGEMNDVGRFLEIRQADAHAWTEVWLKGKGWTRVDPTVAVAPERVEKGVNVQQQTTSGAISFDIGQSSGNSLSGKLVRQIRQAWQNADYSWQRWVINYNNTNQSKFLSNFGIQNLQGMLVSLLISGAVLMLILFWWLMRQPKPVLDQAALIYQQFIIKLAKLHLYKQSTETANAFAARIISIHPELTETVQRITALYLNIRYGKHTSATELKLLKEQVKSFKPKQSASLKLDAT